MTKIRSMIMVSLFLISALVMAKPADLDRVEEAFARISNRLDQSLIPALEDYSQRPRVQRALRLANEALDALERAEYVLSQIPNGPIGPSYLTEIIVARGSGGTTHNDKSAACGKAESRAYSSALSQCYSKGGSSVGVNYIQVYWGKKSGKEKVCRVDAHLTCRIQK